MRRPDEGVIVEIDGNKFKKARKDVTGRRKKDDYVFCQSETNICFTFSVSAMEEFIQKIKESEELQKRFKINLK